MHACLQELGGGRCGGVDRPARGEESQDIEESERRGLKCAQSCDGIFTVGNRCPRSVEGLAQKGFACELDDI